MNGVLFIVGLILLFAGVFIAAEAPTIHVNSWLAFLGPTIDLLAQSGGYIAVFGLLLVIISAAT